MSHTSESDLIRKLKLIEALHAGATTDGERVAAEEAAERIRERLKSYSHLKTSEFVFKLDDLWQRRLFVALLRRYGIKPYRYPRQRYATVVARMPERFLAETIEPEFRSMLAELSRYMNDVTDRILREAIHPDAEDAHVVEEPKALPS